MSRKTEKNHRVATVYKQLTVKDEQPAFVYLVYGLEQVLK